MKCFAALQGSVPVLGRSADRGCLISHGNSIGVHTRGRATPHSRAQLKSLNVPEGRVVTAAGSSRKVCLQTAPSVPAVQQGYAGGVEGEGCTS